MANRKPLFVDTTTGQVKEIASPDQIDSSLIPSTPAPTQRTFAFFAG